MNSLDLNNSILPYLQSQREAETALNTLQPESVSEETARKENEAMELFLLAKEALPGAALMNFFETVVKMESDPVAAFKDLHAICTGHEELQVRSVYN